MKLKADSRILRSSLINAVERGKFDKYFSGNRTFETMPIVDIQLPNRKSIRKNNTIWRDFTIASKLLYCDPSYVYYMCLKAPELHDIWLEETEDGWEFRTLSGINDDEASEAIPLIRDYLQKEINEKYGYWVPIYWSCEENRGKPDYELLPHSQKTSGT